MSLKKLLGPTLAATFAAAGIALAATQTLTLGASTGPGGILTLFGSTSGSVTLQTAAVAGTGTLFQLPATNGSNTNVLQTDGSGITSWVAGGSGDFIKISTQTATSSADLRWTSLGSYGYHVLKCSHLLPASSSFLYLQYSEDAGSTWKNSGYLDMSTYVGSGLTSGSFFSQSNASVAGALGNPADTGIILGNTTATTGPGVNLTANLYDLASASATKFIDADSNTYDGTYAFHFNGGGIYATDNGAITGLRVIESTGNIQTGKCTLYGVNS